MSSPSDPKATGASTPVSKEASERIALSGVASQKQAEAGAANASPPPSSSSKASTLLTPEQIEEAIEKVLGVKKKQAEEARAIANKPPEPDWANLSEKDALDPRSPISIPVFEHEVPSYMDIQIADPEYMVVWANRDQRRLGQLLAEGYEFLKREHIAPSFPLPLKFDSEGMYVYVDVVAMRVHKRILFGKRKKVIELSLRQLKGQQAFAKSKLANVISKDPRLEEAFDSGELSYYNVEEEVS